MPRGPNKISAKEMQVYWDQFFSSEEYRTKLKERINDGEAPGMESLLHHMTYGKPKETLDLRGGGDGIFILNVGNVQIVKREVEDGQIVEEQQGALGAKPVEGMVMRLPARATESVDA